MNSPSPKIVPSQGDPMLQRPKTSTAPPGLRNLPPLKVPPKPIAVPKPARSPEAPASFVVRNELRMAPCGTKTASKRHKRREESCEVCETAAAGRLRRAALGGREPAKCGEAAGAQKHRRAGEDICTPCRLAENSKRRSYRVKKEAA